MTSGDAEAEANRLLRCGRHREAADFFRIAMTTGRADNPTDIGRFVALRHRLAWCLRRTGRAREIIALYEEVPVPWDHHAFRTLGDLYAETGRLGEAVHSYTTVLAWAEGRLAGQFTSMRVLAHAIHAALRNGFRLCVLEVLSAALRRRGAIYRRRSLGLPMFWSCLADVHGRLGNSSAETAYREAFRRYWSWYAGADHVGVLALSGGGDSGARVRPVRVR